MTGAGVTVCVVVATEVLLCIAAVVTCAAIAGCATAFCTNAVCVTAAFVACGAGFLRWMVFEVAFGVLVEV